MPLSKPRNSHVLSQFSLKGKVTCVTGGSRGIGLQVVTGLAEAGANVAFTYRTASDADAIAARISSETGVTVKAYHGDVRDAAAIKRTIDQIAADFGSLDVVVANAYVGPESLPQLLALNNPKQWYCEPRRCSGLYPRAILGDHAC